MKQEDNKDIDMNIAGLNVALREDNKGCGESFEYQYDDGDRFMYDTLECNKDNLCPKCNNQTHPQTTTKTT